MGMTSTLIFYVVIGLAIAVAMALRETCAAPGRLVFLGATALFFWPLYLPILLSPSGAAERPIEPKAASCRDEMAEAITQVEQEVAAALSSLDGWAEDVLAREQDQIAELRAAWRAQAERIRQMDALLEQPARVSTNSLESLSSPNERSTGRLLQSENARRENIERLREVRRQAYDDLLGTLAWVRELVTMIHLAKFTGAPASRAEELVAQIAAAVEGLTEVTSWQGKATAVNTPNHSEQEPVTPHVVLS